MLIDPSNKLGIRDSRDPILHCSNNPLIRHAVLQRAILKPDEPEPAGTKFARKGAKDAKVFLCDLALRLRVFA